jgi:hypothetical protein
MKLLPPRNLPPSDFHQTNVLESFAVVGDEEQRITCALLVEIQVTADATVRHSQRRLVLSAKARFENLPANEYRMATIDLNVEQARSISSALAKLEKDRAERWHLMQIGSLLWSRPIDELAIGVEKKAADFRSELHRYSICLATEDWGQSRIAFDGLESLLQVQQICNSYATSI